MKTKLIFLSHIGTTLAMFGIIWFAQIVHYPLFQYVGVNDFSGYEALHVHYTSWIVVPLMLIEVSTGVLFLWSRPEVVSIHLVWTGLLLLGVIWLSTVWLQVPNHRVLSSGFDKTAHHMLVATNWIRTAAWTLRAVLVLVMTAKAIPVSTK